MLNILVVDDEPKHRKGLSRMLQGLNPKYNIFHARDGVEALESISVHPIDLVFTDIQMPVMGGLEFVEHLTRRGGNESVIIMSAHSEFAYAQRALQLGACDYLLKPVEEDRIAPLLAKAEQKASTVRLASVQSALSELFEGGAGKEVALFLHSCFPAFKRGLVLAAVFGAPGASKFLLGRLKAILEPAMKECGFSCAFYTSGNMLVTLIINSEPASIMTPALESKLREMIRNFMQEYEAELTIGIGREFTEWGQEARRSYKQACGALKTRFYKGGGTVYGPEQTGTGDRLAVVTLAVDELAKAVFAGNKPEICSHLDSAVQRAIASGYPEPEKLKFSLTASIHHLTSNLMEKGHTPLHSAVFEEALLHCQHVEEMNKAAREWLLELSDRLNDRKRCKAESIIESCKTYIATHYHEEDLSLSTLAVKFHFNPSYFCNLFKTHSRMTIHQYITQTRMKAAAKLLLHTSQKVYQIAENVGYKDVKYFIRLFRKEFGTSPEEYRHLSAIR